jgi:ankyrin repeat protein/beta-lactamase regulating signal transducer with metallopeptidase domain
MTNRAIDWLDGVKDLAGADAFALALAVKATLLVLLGAAVVLALSRAGAATRHLGWALTVASLLALPVLLAWAPAFDLPVLPGESATSPVAGATGEPLGVERPADLESAAPVSRAAVEDPGPSTGVEPSRASRISLASGLYWTWFLGMAACLAYLAVGLARVAWLGRRAVPADDDARDRVEALRSAMGVRQAVSVRFSDRVSVPLAYSLRRPVILLPAEARGWDDAQWRDVLMHELAHVARRDWPVQLAGRLACALYWFHPLVWWSARRLTLEAERACDDRVLLAGSDSCGYAERLLKVASGGRPLADPSYAAVAMARRTDLATRIRSILDGRVRRRRLRALPALLVAVALLIPLAALSTARLARADAPASEASPEPAPRPAPAPDPAPDVRDRRRASRSVPVVDRPTPLLAAVWNGDRNAVRILLDGGADPNVSVDGDGTPLIAAVQSGDEAMVRLLLGGGADPGLWVSGDGSPLFHAAASGDERTAGQLLDAGADPNVEIPGDGNALIVAAREGHLDVVELLVARGAEIDRVVPGDENPLIRAAGGGHLEVVRYLLDMGADPNVRVVIEPNVFQPDGDIRTPLSMARRGGHRAVVELLEARGARE